ncbi:hypothetical protein PYCC9005_005893 [Savitreella phatthalungensis]
MPGQSVSIVDYLAIDVACRYTVIQRPVVATYFDITVNTLNARLRTCADRLRSFDGITDTQLRVMRQVASRGKAEILQQMHPVWCIAKEMIRGYMMDGFDSQSEENLIQWALKQEFARLSRRPEDKMEDLPSGRKRKHDGVFSATGPLPVEREPTPPLEVSPAAPPVVPVEAAPQAEQPAPADSPSTDRPPAIKEPSPEPELPTYIQTAAQSAATYFNRPKNDVYTSHDLLIIYIARRVRMLDWDSISDGLGRFKTPTIAQFQRAKEQFEPLHERLLEAMRLCMWPEDSIYLMGLAAVELIDLIDSGSLEQELRDFKQETGRLHACYTGRQIERCVRKVLESPLERKRRKRRERKLGFDWLSFEDHSKLSSRQKRYGACGECTRSVRNDGTVIKRVKRKKSKEELDEEEHEKQAMLRLLKRLQDEQRAKQRKPAKTKPEPTRLPVAQSAAVPAPAIAPAPAPAPAIAPAPAPAPIAVQNTATSRTTASVATSSARTSVNPEEKRSETKEMVQAKPTSKRLKYDVSEEELRQLEEHMPKAKRISYALSDEDRKFIAMFDTKQTKKEKRRKKENVVPDELASTPLPQHRSVPQVPELPPPPPPLYPDPFRSTPTHYSSSYTRPEHHMHAYPPHHTWPPHHSQYSPYTPGPPPPPPPPPRVHPSPPVLVPVSSPAQEAAASKLKQQQIWDFFSRPS